MTQDLPFGSLRCCGAFMVHIDPIVMKQLAHRGFGAVGNSALAATHQLSLMREVSETGHTKADRRILNSTDKKRSQQRSDEQGQKSIWMFPSNKMVLCDKAEETL